MKPLLKNVLFSLVAFAAFFLALEGISRFFFSCPGSFDYVERRILEQGLELRKPKGEFRVMLYGESTMQGDALYPKAAPERILKAYFEDLLGPEDARKVKIYNLARLGSNSHFLARSFLDTVHYKPDAAVFYSAHNDFVQLNNRRSEFDPKPLRFGQKGWLHEAAEGAVRRSAFLSEMNRLNIRLKIWRHARRDRGKARETGLIETYEKFYNPEGDAIEQESPVFRTIFANWEANLAKVAEAGRKNGVPVIFIDPVSNLKEYSPNESRHSAALTGDRLAAWEARFAEAETRRRAGDWAAAEKLYRACVEEDGEHAMAHYRLGQALEALGRHAEAKEEYVAANDEDRVPLRAPSAVHHFYHRLGLSRTPGVHVVETREFFRSHALHAIPDGELLVDTMHPSPRGAALMCEAMLRLMHGHGIWPSAAAPDWKKLSSFEALEKRLGLDEEFYYLLYLQKAGYVGRFYDKAIEYATKALELRPDSLEAKRHLAWALWRKGERDGAAHYYEQIREASPQTLDEIAAKQPEMIAHLMASRRRARNKPAFPVHP